MAGEWLGQVKGSASEADKISRSDAEQRRREYKKADSIILSAKDISSGNWDAIRVLQTTIGGALRDITTNDLAVFKRNMETAKKKFNSKLLTGITAKQVIDFADTIVSGKEADLRRAVTQITMAVPVGFNSGRVRFITNASAKSNVKRHHVTVEFLGYQSEASSGSTTPKLSAQRMRRMPLKIECDCGRWRYWFRYIATIGNFNAGRKETGFPKVRNPKLKGVACKHILRVMAEIQRGGAVQTFIARSMTKAKNSDEAKAMARQAQKEAEKIIKGQARRTSGNEIKTSGQKNIEKLALAASKTRKVSKASAKRAISGDKVEAMLRQQLSVFGLVPTQSMIDEAILNNKRAKT